MSYHNNLRALAACQDRYDNMCPPDPDELPFGCKDDDYDDWDDWDDWDEPDEYDGIWGGKVNYGLG